MPRSLEKKELDRYDSSQTQASFSLLQTAWKRKTLIVLGAVVGLVIASVYYFQRPAVYESTAQIMVERTFPAGPAQGIDSTSAVYEDYLSTQIEVLRSPRVINLAVNTKFDKTKFDPELVKLHDEAEKKFAEMKDAEDKQAIGLAAARFAGLATGFGGSSAGFGGSSAGFAASSAASSVGVAALTPDTVALVERSKSKADPEKVIGLVVVRLGGLPTAFGGSSAGLAVLAPDIDAMLKWKDDLEPKFIQVKLLPSYKAFTNEASVTSNIRSSLIVTRVVSGGSTPTNILNLTVRGPNLEPKNSDDCRMVLQQIIASYESLLRKDHEKNSAKAWKELNEMHTALEKEIASGNERLKAIQQTNQLVRTKEGSSLQLETLQAYKSQLANVSLRRAEIEVRLAAINDAVEQRKDPTPFLELTVDNKISNSPEGSTLEEWLRPLFIRQAELLAKFGPEYPDVKEIRTQIEARKLVWQEEHAEPAPDKPNPKEKVATKEVVDAFVKQMNGQLTYFKVQEDALSKVIDGQSNFLLRFDGVTQAEEILRKDIDDKRELARSYRKRMDEVALVKDHGGIATETMAEPVPSYQVEPRLLPILLPGLMGGLLVGVALAWLAEVSDQTFRNPEDIRRRLKVQVLGHVPRISPTAEEKKMAEQGLLPLDPSVCAFYQPKSVDAESFRGLRTTLFFKLEGAGHRIIQVTSPNMGDGKTTLATNLAVSIAQSGKRILLVDADFRRPRLHKMFGMDATTGLASVIAEDTDLQDAIQATPVPNLSLLPCGPRPNNPAELLTSQRFLDLLEVLREQFDIILIDTPPLLAVSDPSVVAPRVDGVLLTIRVAKNGRPAAERAREMLTNLGANVYGVVVNGIDGGANQGYGASQYGYSYNYAYGYTYDAADNSSYYHDADADAAAKGAAHHGNGTNGKARSGRSRQKQRKEPSGLIRWLRAALWH